MRKTSGAAKFFGTYDDFHFHVGPSIRNMVQAITKSSRKGKCANCDHVGQLDAAHKIGRSRMKIVEEVLTHYLVPNTSFVDCNLNEAFTAIKDAHADFEEVFDFICKSCHILQTAEEKRVSGVVSTMSGSASTAVSEPDLEVASKANPGSGSASLRAAFGRSERSTTITTQNVVIEIHPKGVPVTNFEHTVRERQDRLGRATIFGQALTRSGNVIELDDWTVRGWKPSTPFWSNARTHHVRRLLENGVDVVKIDYAFDHSDLPNYLG